MEAKDKYLTDEIIDIMMRTFYQCEPNYKKYVSLDERQRFTSIQYKIPKENTLENGYLMFRIFPDSKTSAYIEFRPLINKEQYAVNDNGWAKVQIRAAEDIYALQDNIEAIYQKMIYESSDMKFGCCSQYKACSRLNECVNKIPELKVNCAYRLNLLGGKNFLRVPRIFCRKYRSRKRFILKYKKRRRAYPLFMCIAKMVPLER
jgi:hypothetical protein